MTGIPTELATHAVAYTLVLARLAGLFVFAPMLASTAVPLKVRSLFAVMLAAALYPTIATIVVPPATDIFGLLPLVIGESLVGVTIGLLAAIPIFSVQLAGLIMSQQMGISLAAAYNPALDTESDVMGELLLYVAFSVFIFSGGLESLFLCVGHSFQTLPVGGFVPAMAPATLLISLISAGFELAIRVSAPVLVIILLETLASAFVMKTIPQINILTIGFAIKIVLGLLGLTLAIATIDRVVGDDVTGVSRVIFNWVQSLGPAPAPSAD
ncbi:MAG: flagellar biosynthetic protein FliR [Phycisphaeraceae bacterium]|nr:flagellar biosynthetic protein FliR [Phycisphaeraceae bacterium]